MTDPTSLRLDGRVVVLTGASSGLGARFARVLHGAGANVVVAARRGVRVNAIAPGWFPSEMTATMWDDERSLRWIERKVPMGRGGHEHELDGALLFLASDASTYVTGQVLAVDGGYTAI